MDFKKIAGGLILVIGVFAFIISINNNLNFALIYLTAALILWVLYGLILDVFDVQFFAWIISVSGFLVAISVFLCLVLKKFPIPLGLLFFIRGALPEHWVLGSLPFSQY